MRKQISKITFIFLLMLLFAACASSPGFEGHGDLSGLVVDENNQPVSDFIVYCKLTGKKKSAAVPVITNESGLFVFYDLPSGAYILYGSKTNYLKIPETEYHFYDRTRIICFQTKSFKSAVLQADQLIRLGQIKEADKLLKNISCEKESREALMIRAYEFYVNDEKSEKKKVISDLQKNEIAAADFFRDYSLGLEEVIK